MKQHDKIWNVTFNDVRSFSEQFKNGQEVRTALTLSVLGRLYTSESDVCRRQILTYKDGPRTKKMKYL